MKRTLVVVALVLMLTSGTPLDAQSFGYGDVINRARNVHAGNLIRLTFHNNGRLGSVRGDQSVVYGGEWPIGSGKVQVGNTSGYVMSELRIFSGFKPGTTDSTFALVVPGIWNEGWDPNIFPHDTLGKFQGFEPLSGFLNLTQKEKDPQHAIAMSHQAFSWPPFWPDKTGDVVDPGWSNHWNGYFGKDQQNADEESYYVMDDYQYNRLFKGLKLPVPLPSEPKRGGLGLRMSVRGLQWSNPDAEDCIFFLYDIRNFGILNHDKTLFGVNTGASMGGIISGGGSDYADDAAGFYREKSLAVSYDVDNIGIGGYSPVPWLGFAFLESPGNPYDGIDNDGDANDPAKPGGGTGKVITIADFAKSYQVGNQIVLINYNSPLYDRTVTTMPATGIRFTKKGKEYFMPPNTPLIELERNGVDDNLNGIIDESDGTIDQDSVKQYLYIRSPRNNQDYLAKDYITGVGNANYLIDERRDDKLDNDGDWDLQFDDVGLDGKPGTGDQGEGDGVPTAGIGELPGEPNIDIVDVDESDQIGLTSFKFYRYGTLTYSNDDQMWDFSRPGYFDTKTTETADYDYVFSSGFFPLRPNQKEFFSLALLYGWDETDILRNKETVQKIYNSNYNFAIAPTKPKLRAVAEDKKVTLYWDDGAEQSFDRFLKVYDFEGYKVYKATYHTFEDAGAITDGLGYDRFKQPIAIYDKIDSVFGFFPKDFGTGVLFNLGKESGLVHTYVDTDVINGMRYYYAVTAYDRGDVTKNIGPTETTIFVNVDQSGNIQFGENVLAVTPQSPSLGYRGAGFAIAPKLQGNGFTSGKVGVNIINPDSVRDGDEYEIQFLDQSMDKKDNNNNTLIDKADKTELLPNVTSGYVLRNITRNTILDTTWIYTWKIENNVPKLTQNLYDDKDGDPNSFTKVQHGLEIYVKNPIPAVYNDEAIGISKGIKWSGSIDPLKAYQLQFDKFALSGFKPGTVYPRQYRVVFDSVIVDTSDQIKLPLATGTGTIPVPRVPVNFKVYDMQSGDPIRFGFIESNLVQPVVRPKGYFSAKDRIVFYEKLINDSVLITYSVLNNDNEDTTYFSKNNRYVGKGDTLYLYTDNQFNGSNRYRFTVRGQSIDNAAAKQSMSNIKVVPNPYIISAIWEPRNPYTSGRGDRVIQFINLPQQCTIRIYTVDGTLVRTLDHQASMNNGAETWNLLTKENMDVSYGVYVYHVDAPGVGQHIGKIFVIK